MDETAPLLPGEQAPQVPQGCDKYIVDFDANGDGENPRDWSPTYKWGIVALLAFTAFAVTFNCISVVPIATHISLDLDGHTSKSASVLAVTIWELGEAAGPLFIAPLSEVFGRYPVMNVVNTLFVLFTAFAALSQSSSSFVAARFLSGLAVSTNVLNPAIVGDLFEPEERGSRMSIIQLAPLVGGAAGPAIAGAIAEEAGWRACVWMSVGLAAVAELLFLTCFRETYKVPILRRRAERLRRETGDGRWRTEFEMADDDEGGDDEEMKKRGEEGGGGVKGGYKKVWGSAMRPAAVFWGSGVLQGMSLFGSLTFAVFYIMSTSLPEILEDRYDLRPALAGASFAFFSLGSSLAVLLCNYALDRIYVYLSRRNNNGVGKPEYRLPLLVLGGLTLPLAMMFYGWSAELKLPVPTIFVSVALQGATLMLGFLPVMTYVVDAFGIYSASAITAVLVSRCLMGTFLPLATGPLVERWGWGWAMTIFAGAMLVVTPIPMLILRYGSIWRKRSKYTVEQTG